MSWWEYRGSPTVSSSQLRSGSWVFSGCCPVLDYLQSLAPCPLLPCRACLLNTQSRTNTRREESSPPLPALWKRVSSCIQVPPLPVKTTTPKCSYIYASWAL